MLLGGELTLPHDRISRILLADINPCIAVQGVALRATNKEICPVTALEPIGASATG
jgi:hypothetical protein